MITDGKTLFFNESDGHGIIITSARKKIKFGVEEWDDFDIMPSKGLEVVFTLTDGIATNIISKESHEIEKENSEPEPTQEIIVEKQEEIIIKEKEQEVLIEEEKVKELVSYEKEEIPQKKVAPSPDAIMNDISRREKKHKEDTKQAVESLRREQEEDRGDFGGSKQETNKSKEETPQEKKTIELEKGLSAITEETVQELVEAKRPESITNSITIATAVSNYFAIIRDNIERRKAYKKINGRMEYMLISRFLWTTYNNLAEIDIQIVTPKIQMLSDDLKAMGNVHEDFVKKTKYPPLAYEEVFLTCQAEYQKIRNGAKEIIENLTRLRMDEKKLGGVREIKKNVLKEHVNTIQFDTLEGELKSLNGAYVDVVHMMAELDERYKKDMKILHEFEVEYRDDFYKIFATEAKKYKFALSDILNAQASLFDIQLWNEAKRSKSVKTHFKSSSISGELNTKTYLKYFLSTQDRVKATGETKILFDVYDKLVLMQKNYALVVTQNPQEAMEFENAIKKIDNTIHAKSFVDEIAAVKWAMKNSVLVLVVEEQLRKTRVEKFLDLYSKNVLSVPDVIVIGNKPKTNTIAIKKLVPDGVSPRVLAKAVQLMINKHSKDEEIEEEKKD